MRLLISSNDNVNYLSLFQEIRTYGDLIRPTEDGILFHLNCDDEFSDVEAICEDWSCYIQIVE